MGQIQSHFLNLDEVMTYFEFKIGKVAIMSALRKGHLIGELREKEWYFNREWIEKQYRYPIDNPKREVRFITPKDLLTFYFPEMSMTNLYRDLNDGTIPSVRVGSKILVLKCELEATFKRPYTGV